MEFKVLATASEKLAQTAADALIWLVTEDAATQGTDPALRALLEQVVDAGDLAWKPGRSVLLHKPQGLVAKRLVIAVASGGGAASAKAVKAAVGAALAQVKQLGVKHVAVLLGMPCDDAHAEAVVAAASDAVYLYRHTKPSAPEAPQLAKLSLIVERAQAKAAQAGLDRGVAIAEGVKLARECGNRPANHCTPSFLADEAKKLGKRGGIKCEVLERKDCEKLGMGSFLAVAQGSYEPLKFIVLRYDGAPDKGRKAQAPVVLVGKGITFDTGGISIKPAPDMDEMKFDMCGAASVLGVFRTLAELQPKLNVVGLIPACENMPSGRSVKPGDVVTSMSGQTIEVLNTDAEGRLILCDALTYAERFKPAAVIDIATLTGACVIALGHHRSGLFSTDEALAQALLACGERALDPAWRMPLDDEYEEALKSNFADMGNVGGRAGGAITAAMFLRKFAGKLRWAHLDIAGTAWKSGAQKGATGRPVPLLVHYLLSR
ncbi:MAG TPA: leucyl aminopeptidase [Methylibium sp.]|uniref:leucyl aminopeptidase n=1 Tax=Methylibium sp. TaxID=2067992 RepID=UPI002DB6C8CE|nr:leucyl aminopeptidase [Methylibium sp.]HEU4460162.1 leucyl aminopeptidase [Methylibium sp.]